MYTDHLIDAVMYSTGVLSMKVLTAPAFLSVAAFRLAARERNSSSERPLYLRIRSGLKLIGQGGIPVVGSVEDVEGVDVDVDGLVEGVGGINEGASCWTSAWKVLTISFIGSERNFSTSGADLGHSALTRLQCMSHSSAVSRVSI